MTPQKKQARPSRTNSDRAWHVREELCEKYGPKVAQQLQNVFFDFTHILEAHGVLSSSEDLVFLGEDYPLYVEDNAQGPAAVGFGLPREAFPPGTETEYAEGGFSTPSSTRTTTTHVRSNYTNPFTAMLRNEHHAFHLIRKALRAHVDELVATEEDFDDANKYFGLPLVDGGPNSSRGFQPPGLRFVWIPRLLPGDRDERYPAEDIFEGTISAGKQKVPDILPLVLE